MTDATEAIRTMRRKAKEWHFYADRVGIIGFSAGGHLASTMLVNDHAAARPDFGILFYPVISMRKELTHKDSHDLLLGEYLFMFTPQEVTDGDIVLLSNITARCWKTWVNGYRT